MLKLGATLIILHFKLLITNTELSMSSVILIDEFEEQNKLNDPDIHKLKEEAMDDKLTFVDWYRTNIPGKRPNYSLNYKVLKEVKLSTEMWERVTSLKSRIRYTISFKTRNL